MDNEATELRRLLKKSEDERLEALNLADSLARQLDEAQKALKVVRAIQAQKAATALRGAEDERP
jgi:hypothetical protein